MRVIYSIKEIVELLVNANLIKGDFKTTICQVPAANQEDNEILHYEAEELEIEIGY